MEEEGMLGRLQIGHVLNLEKKKKKTTSAHQNELDKAN